MGTKTNALRLIQQAGIPCRESFYEYDENDLRGTHAANAIGMPEEQVFKTLVARGDRTGIHVFCIPVCCELDLKKAAKAAGDKKIELVAVKELLGLTGYIRGGCSPVGMKKQYPTHFDEI
jgi:Cys-tRNA(Pro)/Cys-tRNA(Cys) deacylase